MKIKLLMPALIVIGILFFSSSAVAQEDSLPKNFIEATLQVPEAHPVVGYPFTVSTLIRVHQISKQGKLVVEDPPRIMKAVFLAPPPITGKTDPYIVTDYVYDDLLDGFTPEGEFTCKDIGQQPIEFIAPISYHFKSPEGQELRYDTDISLTKNVTCAGPSLESFNFKKSCESATFTGKIGRGYLAELDKISLRVTESEVGLAGNPSFAPESDGSFSYTMKLKPSLYHFWVKATTKKGITYEMRGENSFDIEACEDEPAKADVRPARDSIDGEPCVIGESPSIYQCTSSNSFTYYQCRHPDWPGCQKLIAAAEAQDAACAAKYGIHNDSPDSCVLPLANAYGMSPDNRDANNEDDKEIEKKYVEMEAECREQVSRKAAGEDVWVDPCCQQISGARECSALIIQAREAVEVCRYRTDYKYKAEFTGSCATCASGKIIDQFESCVESAATTPKPTSETSESGIDTDISRLARFRAEITKGAEKIISIKECGLPRLPSQNSCVAEKLNSVIELKPDDLLDPAMQELKSRLSGPANNFGPRPSYATEFIPVDSTYTLTQALLRKGLPKETVQKISEKTESAFEPAPQTAQEILGKFRYELSPSTNLMVLDADNFSEASLPSVAVGTLSEASNWKPLIKGSEFSKQGAIFTGENSTVRIGNKAMILEIKPKSIVVAGATPSDTMSAEKEFVPKLITVHEGGVRVWNEGGDAGNDLTVETPLTVTKSKHTQFAVAYDPENQYAITVIYEGEVEVTNKLTGETAILTPTDEGKPRALVASLATTSEKKDSLWTLTIIILLLLGGTGFWLYKKGLFKKFMVKKFEA